MEYKKTEIFICKACGGKGHVYPSSYLKTAVDMAKKLRKKGMTVRAICKEMGIKNPQTVKRMTEEI